jgi:hypothetical protein
MSRLVVPEELRRDRRSEVDVFLGERSADAFGVFAEVDDRNKDPIRSVVGSEASFVVVGAPVDANFPLFSQGVDRLAREPQQRCGAARRYQLGVEFLEQLVEAGSPSL